MFKAVSERQHKLLVAADAAGASSGGKAAVSSFESERMALDLTSCIQRLPKRGAAAQLADYLTVFRHHYASVSLSSGMRMFSATGMVNAHTMYRSTATQMF